MARNFIDVYERIKEVAPEELVEKLESRVGYWAPEVVWYNLSQYINKYLKPSSTNKTSVAVYAILLDCSESEMKKRFEADGL